MESAFNDESVCGGVYRLQVEFWAGDDWSDAYYEKMLVGRFDLGYGANPAGGSLDPLQYMAVLSGDPKISGGFTLSWALDTNAADGYPLVYDGRAWSFDALLAAALGRAQVSDGKLIR